tara:strand:- start:421 stop:939 length:519 start_codon:yes stop_codon:yes gene_type:complete
MKIFKIIIFLLFSFALSSNLQAFTDRDGKGSQSSGREDKSFLEAKNSNFKKGNDSLKKAFKFLKKEKITKANNHFEKALRYFVLANQENSQNITIFNNLGLTYYMLGDLMMSEIYYQEGLLLEPNNPIINEKLGELYFNTKRLSLANERLEVLRTCNCQEYSNLKNIIKKSK